MVVVTYGGDNAVGRGMIIADTYVDQTAANVNINYGHEHEIILEASAGAPYTTKRGLMKVQLPDDLLNNDNKTEISSLQLYAYGYYDTGVGAVNYPMGIFNQTMGVDWEEGLGGGGALFPANLEPAFDIDLADYTLDDCAASAGNWDSQPNNDAAFANVIYLLNNALEIDLSGAGTDTDAYRDYSLHGWTGGPAVTTYFGYPAISIDYACLFPATPNFTFYIEDGSGNQKTWEIVVLGFGAWVTETLYWVDGIEDPGFDRDDINKIGVKDLDDGKIYYLKNILLENDSGGVNDIDIVITSDAGGYANSIYFRDSNDDTYLGPFTLGDSGTYPDVGSIRAVLDVYNYTINQNASDAAPNKYLWDGTYLNILGGTDINWDMTYPITQGCSWSNVNEYTDTGDWNGTHNGTSNDDYGIGKGGYISVNNFPSGASFLAATWVCFDITRFITKGNYNWGDIIPLNFILCTDEVGYYDEDTANAGIEFYSKEGTAIFTPYILLKYIDEKPVTNILSVLPYSNDITIPQFKWTNVDKNDIDIQQLRIYVDNVSPVLIATGATNVETNVGLSIEDISPDFEKSDIFSINAPPTENTLWYYRLFIEDNNNTGDDSGLSNNVSIIRPEIGDFAICTTDGNEYITTGINVQTEVVAVIFGYGSNITPYVAVDDINTQFETFSGIKKGNIDWGDGTYSENINMEYDYLDNDCMTDDVIDVHNPDKFKVGDLIVIYERTGQNYSVRTVIATSNTNITVNANVNTDYIKEDSVIYVANDFVHKYNYYGSMSAKCQLVNDQGFGSDWTLASGAPDNPLPQPINPVCKLKVSPKIGYTNELVDTVINYNGTTYTNYTSTASSEYTTDTFTLDIDVTGNYIIFGNDNIFNNLTFYVSTARTAGTWEWRYSTTQNPGTWSALTPYRYDSSTSFSASGSNYLVFDVPTDWIKYESKTNSIPEKYYVGLFKTNAVNPDPQPILRTIRKYTTFKASLTNGYSRLSNELLSLYAFYKSWGDASYHDQTYITGNTGGKVDRDEIDAITNDGTGFTTSDYFVLTDGDNSDIRAVVSKPNANTIRLSANTSFSAGKTGGGYSDGIDSTVSMLNATGVTNDGYVGTVPYFYCSYPETAAYTNSTSHTIYGFVANDDPIFEDAGDTQTIGSIGVSETVTMSTLPVLKIDTKNVNPAEADLSDFQVSSFSTETKLITGDALLRYYITTNPNTVRSINLTSTATTDTDGDGIPDDIVRVLLAQKRGDRVQITTADSTGRIYLHGYISNVSPQESHQSGEQWPYSITVILPEQR